MGFDGYYQRICGNGHNYVADALSEMYEDPTACHLCDSDTIVEENLVDTTNGCVFNDSPCPCGRKTVVTLENGKQTLGAPEAHGTLDLPKRRTAKYNMKITSFDGEHRFLSNFFPSVVSVDVGNGPEVYQTVEHAYQAQKTWDPTERAAIRAAATPGEAKALGRTVTMRSDWEEWKEDIMLELLTQKFRHEHLREMLLATGESELVEGNTWGDTYWGVCNGEGQNKLGKLLMMVRDDLKDETGISES